MSMTDPVADMLTRIRNAQMAEKLSVTMPSSKLKVAIAKVLKDEGYIDDFAIRENGAKPELGPGAEVLRWPSGDRAHRTCFEARPARLQGQGRLAARNERAGCCHRFHAEGRNDRPSSTGGQHGRRSSLHRRLRRMTLMSRIAKYPVEVPKGVEVMLSDAEISVKGPLGTLKQFAALGKDRKDGDKLHCAVPSRDRLTPARCQAPCARWSTTWCLASPRASKRN
jgi:hypothetical protein